MAMPTMPKQLSRVDCAPAYVTRAVLRLLQFIFAIIVAILYGIDLSHASSTGGHAGSAWVFAEVLVAFSVVACITHYLISMRRRLWFLCDGILVVLWAAHTGVFGQIFISNGGKTAKGEGSTLSVARMKAAVWISLLNMFLWMTTLVLCCCAAKKVPAITGERDLEDNRALRPAGSMDSGNNRPVTEIENGGLQNHMPKRKLDNMALENEARANPVLKTKDIKKEFNPTKGETEGKALEDSDRGHGSSSDLEEICSDPPPKYYE